MAGERIICIPDDFLLSYSKQSPKISALELPELYILTKSVMKACKKKNLQKQAKMLDLLLGNCLYGNNRVLCKFYQSVTL